MVSMSKTEVAAFSRKLAHLLWSDDEIESEDEATDFIAKQLEGFIEKHPPG